MSLTIKCISSEELEPFISDLARLRVQVFREYPYLYEGDETYEKNYLSTYLNSKKSFLVIVLDHDQVVGASTAIPLKDEIDDVKTPFINNNYNIDDLFYFGESVLLPAYRGQKIGYRFFAEREAEAKRQAYAICTFCGVDRPKNHSLRPKDWHPLDTFWQNQGYVKHPELVAYYTWKEIGADEATTKPMIFWMKKLG